MRIILSTFSLMLFSLVLLSSATIANARSIEDSRREHEADVRLMKSNPEGWKRKHFGSSSQTSARRREHEEDVRLMRTNPEAWRRKHFPSSTSAQSQRQRNVYRSNSTPPLGRPVSASVKTSVRTEPFDSTAEARRQSKTKSTNATRYNATKTEIRKSTSPPRKAQDKVLSTKALTQIHPRKDANVRVANWPWKESLNLDTMSVSPTDQFDIGKLRPVSFGDAAKLNVSEWLKQALETKSQTITIGALAIVLKYAGKVSALLLGLATLLVAALIKLLSPVPNSQRPGLEEPEPRSLSPIAMISAFGIGVGAALLIPVPASMNASATPEELEFTPVHSADFKFHLYMPEPFIKEVHIDKQNGLEMPFSVIGHASKDPLRRRELLLAYASIPSAEKLYKAKIAASGMPSFQGSPVLGQQVYYYLDPEKGLDAAVDRIKKLKEIDVTKVTRIGLQDEYSGRELEGNATDGSGRITRTRIYVVANQMLVQLAVAGDPTWVNSNEAYKFFDSLAIDLQ